MDNADLEKLLPELQQQTQQHPHQPYQHLQALLQNLHDPQALQDLLQALLDPLALRALLQQDPLLVRKLRLAVQARDNYLLTHGPAVAIWLGMLLASFVLTAWNNDNGESGVDLAADLAAKEHHRSLAARLTTDLQITCFIVAVHWVCCEVLDRMAMRAPSDSWQRQVLITLRCSVLTVLMVGMSVAMALLKTDE
ncbi:hypothetical protein LTR91_000996 [Friedmanniomyces endolithicus]|uniref:Uncharacterized protein n=1 Tax=Friedmanniomyces endolithicus TaxID=329885 RepID=A0A4U0V412_9PEZI|nr:hypothetical protein LTS09_009821 [Friedmanniomyces endolithicus]KAK0271105.1 hypothetical protein LTR35_013666 [Friedmanniomyces endolithicus]KAK0277628.1 hypothetical protein LTS00_014119 [Friedmanniomyces endolithicus]KAK0307469.1 hypothetical protein LTR01_005469 [Friedmanniomyces endolithicus]KAK0314328.1 hypothetical protein LTR82_013045 [Friedmanniomyces endolithicus]